VRPPSLRNRLVLLVVALSAVLLGAASVSAYVAIRNVYLGHIDRMLAIMANAVAAELDDTDDPAELAAEARAVTESPWKGTGTHFRIWRDGQPDDLAASMPKDARKVQFLRELTGSAGPAPDERQYLDLKQKKKDYRAIWVRHRSSRGDFHVLIAHPSSYEHRRLRDLLGLLAAVDGGLVLLAVLLAGPLVRLAVRPITRTAERVAGVSHRSPADPGLQRLRVPVELEPFVRAVRQLLSRLHEVLDRHKQFTANASHELRTPLSLAQSTLQLVCEEGCSPEDYRRAVAEALGDLERMGELMRQLLLLAEVDGLREIPEPAEIALDAVLGELAAAYELRATQAGGHVVCDALAPVCVRGSEELIRQMFANLLDNALKHGPKGGTVRLRLEYTSGGTCLAAVEDEGGGLAEESLSLLFDRFHREGAARQRGTPGSGLGLAIAKQIALLHGGEIWAATSPGRRTTFCVRLPCSVRVGDDRPDESVAIGLQPAALRSSAS